MIDSDLAAYRKAHERRMVRRNVTLPSWMNSEAAKQYMAAGHSEFKSMLPKIRAAVDFVESGRNRTAIITSLAKAQAALKGRAGTRIA